MALADDIANLPTTPTAGQTGRLANDATVIAGLKSHETRVTAAKAAADAAAALAGTAVQLDGNGLVPDNRIPAGIARDSETAAAVLVETTRATTAEQANATAAAAALAAAQGSVQPAALTTALATKADLVGGKIPTSQIPAVSTHETVSVANRAAMLALTSTAVQTGDVVVIGSSGAVADRGLWLLTGADPGVIGSWFKLDLAAGTVQAVNGQAGPTVVLGATDVGAPTTAQLTAETTRATAAEATRAPLLTPTATKTAAYTVAVGERAMMNVAGGAMALLLPTAPVDQATVGFRAGGATTAVPLVVTAGSGDTIGPDGATNATITLAGKVDALQYDAGRKSWLLTSGIPDATLRAAITAGAPGGSTTPAAVAAEGVRFVAFGHSYVANGSDTNTQWAFTNRIYRRYNTQVPLNYGVAGNSMAQTVAQVIANWSANGWGVVTLMAMINDVNAGSTLATTREAFRTCLAYLTSHVILAPTAASFSFGSGWSSGATSTVGSYVDFAWTGDVAHLHVQFVMGSGATLTITDSGTSTVSQTVNTGGYSAAFTGSVRLAGYGAGAHTVRVTYTGGSGLTITSATVPSPTPATVVWLEEGALPSYTAALNQKLTVDIPAALAPVAAQFPTCVPVAPTGWDPATMVSPSDQVHPNDRGKAYWAGRAGDAVQAVGFRQGQNGLTSAFNTGASTLAVYVAGTPSFVAAPGVPGAVTLAVQPATGQNTLTWNAAAENGSAVTAYKVYAGTAAGNETLLTTLGNVLTYTETGLTNGAARYYRVSAVNTTGEGPQSNEVTGTPQANTAPGQPSLLTASPGSGQATLTWQPPSSNGGSAITDYVVQYRTTAGPGTWTTFNDGVKATTGAVVTGLTNGTSYDFQVAAVNAIGTGTYSATASATPVAAYDPSTVAGLAGWYKADSLSLSDGAAVTAWGDSSSAGLPLSTSGSSPSFRASGPNGKPFVQFVRSGNQGLASPGVATVASDSFTLFLVCAITGASQQFDMTLPEGTSIISGYTAGVVEAFQAPRQNIGPWTSGTYAVYELVHPASSGNAIGLANGTVGSTATTGGTANNTAPITLGNPSGSPSDVNICEVLRYKAVVPAADRTAIRQYLGSKYGITVS